MYRTVARKLFVPAAILALALPALAPAQSDKDDFPTTTPIKHVVVIFQENVSFDHYFGTYPHAARTKTAASTSAARKATRRA